jgi:hypothetical protein
MLTQVLHIAKTQDVPLANGGKAEETLIPVGMPGHPGVPRPTAHHSMGSTRLRSAVGPPCPILTVLAGPWLQNGLRRFVAIS